MATLEEFKALRAGVAPEVQTELYGLMTSDPEAGKQRMVEIAAGQGVTLTTEEVRGFLLQMDEEEEFDFGDDDMGETRAHKTEKLLISITSTSARGLQTLYLIKNTQTSKLT